MNYTKLSQFVTQTLTEQANLAREQDKLKAQNAELEKLIHVKNESLKLVKTIHDQIFAAGAKGQKTVTLYASFGTEKQDDNSIMEMHAYIGRVLNEVGLKESKVESCDQHKVRFPTVAIPDEANCNTIISFQI